MTYQECLDYLYSRLPYYQRQGPAAYKADLSNTIALLSTLDFPERKFKSIHIAGTNGKGTSAHAIASILQSAGYKTGLYTSPHLKSFSERIRINGQEIDEKSVVRFVEKMQPQIELINPSFFELTVAMAFEYFADSNIDIAVIETGLGGRLDSTNVIQPEACLITNIGMDHTDLLGDTLSAIAREKAGIIKLKTPVIIGSHKEEIDQIFINLANSKQAQILFAQDTFSLTHQNDAFDIYRKGKLFLSTIKPEINVGYFRKNIPGILSIIETLNNNGWKIELQHIKQGLKNIISITGLKGRFQQLGVNPPIYADISHNTEGITELFDHVKGLNFNHLHLVFGAVKDKKITEILNILPENASFYFTQSSLPRSIPAEELSKIAAEMNILGNFYLNPNEALKEAVLKANKNDLILVTGSTFVVAELDLL